MMRMKNKTKGFMNSPTKNESSVPNGGAATAVGEWEVRPGGMLVQRRTSDDSDRGSVQVPTIRVRVKYGSIYHEINISSQATFGELKKKLAGPTGLHHQDQKLVFKDKERDSNSYLDISGVKDKSKMVLSEDPISKEKRYLEMRRNARMERASKSISEISLEVDKIAGQVSSLESIVSKGKKVAESDVLSLTELLMNQLLKLDGIAADGDAKLQRKMQVRRVQKYVETLDALKIKNSTPSSNGNQNPISHQHKHSNGKYPPPIPQQPPRSTQMQQQQQPPPQHSTSGPVVVTTNWETFDSVPLPSSSTSPKFNWEF